MSHADLYPELEGRGLSSALQEQLDVLGAGLKASWPNPDLLWTRVKRGERAAQISCGSEVRVFMTALWGEGVQYFEHESTSLGEVTAAVSVWLAEEQPTGAETVRQCPYLELEPFADAYERGEAIEFRWQEFLRDPWVNAVALFAEHASNEPTLRQLFPYTSLMSLQFSRWVGYPYSYDLPSANPTSRTGERLVIRDAHDAEIGEGDVREAVQLLVEALPDPLEIPYRRPSGLY
jgi:hypothetical protein